MFNEKNLVNHAKICRYYVENKPHQCKLCEKSFYSAEELSSHLIKCGKFICYECAVPFLTSNALNYHINLYHRVNNTNKQYKCSICKLLCENRRDLYRHRMIQHGGNDNQDMIPNYIIHHENEELKQEYITHRNHILADDDETDDIKKTYNFETNNLRRGYREIRGHVLQIYNRQNNAFRINLAFGMILYNAETGEYRYFIPHFNSKILEYPFIISNQNGIRFFMHKITGIDIIQQARGIRPSTAWTLAFITNVQYVVFSTNFPLGNAIDLPKFLKRNKHLKTLFIDRKTGLPHTDNMCFFRCLKFHKKNVKKTLKSYFTEWCRYKNEKLQIQNDNVFKGIKLM